MKTGSVEHSRWLMLLGAAMTSKEVRDDISKFVDVNLAPSEVKPLLSAMMIGDGRKALNAAEAFSFAAREKSLVKGLVSAVSEAQRLARYRTAVATLKATSAATPDEFVEQMESLLNSLKSAETSC